MAGSKLPGELTWPKLLGTSIAAVVAAWLAGYLGLGNTLTGVAIGSIIATFGAAFFTSAVDKSHQAILVRTERGTIVEVPVESDVDETAGGGTAVLPVQPDLPPPSLSPETPSRWRQIHWRSVVIAALVTMAVTLGLISLYEGAVGRTWGSNEPGTTIGNTVRGGPQPIFTTTPTPTPTPTPSESPTPTEEPTETPTPTEEPTASPTPSPTPTECPTATTSPSVEEGTEPPNDECPTPTTSPTEDTGLLR